MKPPLRWRRCWKICQVSNLAVSTWRWETVARCGEVWWGVARCGSRCGVVVVLWWRWGELWRVLGMVLWRRGWYCYGIRVWCWWWCCCELWWAVVTVRECGDWSYELCRALVTVWWAVVVEHGVGGDGMVRFGWWNVVVVSCGDWIWCCKPYSELWWWGMVLLVLQWAVVMKQSVVDVMVICAEMLWCSMVLWWCWGAIEM